MDCPECGLTVKVPAPIGGTLTDKRIPHQEIPPLLASNYSSNSAAPPLPSFAPGPTSKSRRSPQPRWEARVPREPLSGLSIDFDFDGVFGRDEEDAASLCLESIIKKLKQHFELHADHYRSCALLIVVFRFTTDEVVLRLLGSVNRESIQIDSRVTLQGDAEPSFSLHPIVALASLMLVALSAVTNPQRLTRVARLVANPCFEDFRRPLDEHVGVPKRWWWFW